MRLVLFVVFELILENYWISCDVASDILSYYDGDTCQTLCMDEKDIDNSIINYYYVDQTVRSFHDQWENSRKSYENALEIALKENFGRKSMNTIERKTDNSYKLSNGFYVNDNVIHMIYQDMHLDELPYLRNTQVHFPLADNVLHLQSELSKMIVVTRYSLMRNNSKVMFSSANLDKSSPFVLQQVQNNGILAIMVEDCLLSGFAISLLNGETVILGHNTFKVSDCKITVEISSEGLGSPPVIAPYFSNEQRDLLQNLISKPIQKELMTKLQAAMFSYVNTSIFEDDLVQYRDEQEKIFKKTSKFVKDTIRYANKMKVRQNQAAHNLRPLDIFWNETNNGCSRTRSIKVKNLVLDGLDSAYSPHIGGPYKLRKIGIAETMRYSSLKVRGKIFFECDEFINEHDFSMDLLDVNVNIDMDCEDKSQDFNTDTYVIWSDTVFSITNCEKISERVKAESMISGLLINEIPKFLTKTFLKLRNNVESTVMKSKKVSDKNQQAELERLSDISEVVELIQTTQDPELNLQDDVSNLKKLEDVESLQDETKVEESDVNPTSEVFENGKEKGLKVSISFFDEVGSNESKRIKAERRFPLFKNGNGSENAFGNADDVVMLGHEGGRRKYKKRNKKYNRRGKHHQAKSHKMKKGKKKIGRKKKGISINSFENSL